MVEESQDIRDLREKVEKHEREIAANAHDLKNHRQVLDIKLDTLTTNVTELKNALKWAGGLIISLMLSFMAWAALQQFNANETTKRDLQEQVNLLKNQEKAALERDQILKEIRANEGTATTRDSASIGRDAQSDDLPPSR